MKRQIWVGFPYLIICPSCCTYGGLNERIEWSNPKTRYASINKAFIKALKTPYCFWSCYSIIISTYYYYSDSSS